MTKKNGKLSGAAAAVLLLVAATGLHADPLFTGVSPQSEATRGIYASDADNYMSVRDYVNMDFTRWWSVLSYKRQVIARDSGFPIEQGNGTQLAQIGFATRFGDLYMGLSYMGNGWKQFGRVGITGNIYRYTEDTIDGRTWKVYPGSRPPELYDRYELRNEAALLFGIADMGFKLYYSSNYQENKQSDIAAGTPGNYNFYKSYEEEYGAINPGLVWGMTRDLIPGRGIKPEVRLDLNFIRNGIKQEDYDQTTFESVGMYVRRSQNRFVPGLNVGLGGFTLVTVDDFNFKVDLDYGIKMYFYDGEYSYMDAGGKYQIKSLKGGLSDLDSGSSAKLHEASQTTHTLTPSLKTEWSGDRLGLAARLGLNMSFDNKTDTGKTLKGGSTDGSLVKQGTTDTTTEFHFTPELDLAMQWSIIPEKLFLNAGGEINFFGLVSKTVDRKMYDNDDEEKDRGSYRIENVFFPASTKLYLGTTFNFTPHIELQSSLGVLSNNSVSVFSTSLDVDGNGGFFNFCNILLTVKF
jgi:hypothetical protein